MTTAPLPDRSDPPDRNDLPARNDPPERRIALVDLLDRLLSSGVVITGDVVLSVADVDLVRLSLHALIGSVEPEFDSLSAPRDRTVLRDT